MEDDAKLPPSLVKMRLNSFANVTHASLGPVDEGDDDDDDDDDAEGGGMATESRMPTQTMMTKMSNTLRASNVDEEPAFFACCCCDDDGSIMLKKILPEIVILGFPILNVWTHLFRTFCICEETSSVHTKAKLHLKAVDVAFRKKVGRTRKKKIKNTNSQ